MKAINPHLTLIKNFVCSENSDTDLLKFIDRQITQQESVLTCTSDTVELPNITYFNAVVSSFNYVSCCSDTSVNVCV